MAVDLRAPARTGAERGFVASPAQRGLLPATAAGSPGTKGPHRAIRREAIGPGIQHAPGCGQGPSSEGVDEEWFALRSVVPVGSAYDLARGSDRMLRRGIVDPCT